MLHRFTKSDSLYRSFALKICGDNDLKDDLVNDMYIKLYEYLQKYPEKEKEIDDGYIFITIRNIFYNQVKKKKEFCTGYIPEIETNNETLENRRTINALLDSIPFYDRELLLTTKEESFRSLGRKINLTHNTIIKHHDKALEKLKKLCQEKGLINQQD